MLGLGHGHCYWDHFHPTTVGLEKMPQGARVRCLWEIDSTFVHQRIKANVGRMMLYPNGIATLHR